LRAACGQHKPGATAARGYFRAALVAAACAITLLLLPNRAVAQVTPADSAGVLVGVAARLQAEGRTELAQTLLRLVRERFPNTPAADDAARILAEMQRTIADRSGVTELMVFGTTYGAALGVAVPVAVQSDEPEAYGLGLIVGGPLGFLASRAYARSRSLSEGQASAIISGAMWGTWQAFGWGEVFDLGEEEECFEPQPGQTFCSETGAEAHEIVKTMVVGSLVGLGVGGLLSQKNISNGTAATVNFGALWGTWFGAALGILSDQENDAMFTSVLLGGNAGLVAGAIGNSKWRLSESRARLISIAGVAGGLAGLGLLLVLSPEDSDNTAVLVPLSGSILGLALGTHWTRHMDRDAMIDVQRGRLGFELPSIQLALLEQGRRRVAGVRLNLIQARF
jgi:hypothetical protein